MSLKKDPDIRDFATLRQCPPLLLLLLLLQDTHVVGGSMGSRCSRMAYLAIYYRYQIQYPGGNAQICSPVPTSLDDYSY